MNTKSSIRIARGPWPPLGRNAQQSANKYRHHLYGTCNRRVFKKTFPASIFHVAAGVAGAAARRSTLKAPGINHHPKQANVGNPRRKCPFLINKRSLSAVRQLRHGTKNSLTSAACQRTTHPTHPTHSWFHLRNTRYGAWMEHETQDKGGEGRFKDKKRALLRTRTLGRDNGRLLFHYFQAPILAHCARVVGM